MKHLLLALSFMTTLPVRINEVLAPGALGRAGVWFPLVGMFLGGLLAGFKLLFDQLFPPLLSAALVTTTWTILTGALHLDGLADCCDGLIAPVNRERRLEILRDPRLGTFGGTGLVLQLLLKTAAIYALPAMSILPFVLAATTSRWLILLVARQPSARPGGMGNDFTKGLTPHILIYAALLPLALVILAGLHSVLYGWTALWAVILAHLLSFGIIRLALARLGGVTGDVYGLTVELSELLILLTFTTSLVR